MPDSMTYTFECGCTTKKLTTRYSKAKKNTKRRCHEHDTPVVKVELKCKFCGKMFTKLPTQPAKLYCNPKCAASARRERYRKNSSLNSRRYASNNPLKHHKHKKPKYCSLCGAKLPSEAVYHDGYMVLLTRLCQTCWTSGLDCVEYHNSPSATI